MPQQPGVTHRRHSPIPRTRRNIRISDMVYDAVREQTTHGSSISEFLERAAIAQLKEEAPAAYQRVTMAEEDIRSAR